MWFMCLPSLIKRRQGSLQSFKIEPRLETELVQPGELCHQKQNCIQSYEH